MNVIINKRIAELEARIVKLEKALAKEVHKQDAPTKQEAPKSSKK